VVEVSAENLIVEVGNQRTTKPSTMSKETEKAVGGLSGVGLGLDELVRQGARQVIQQAIEAELAELRSHRAAQRELRWPIPAGDHRREAGWEERARGDGRRVSGGEGPVARTAARPEGAWPAGWSAAGSRRRRDGLLGGARGSVSGYARPALLVPQDVAMCSMRYPSRNRHAQRPICKRYG
jgi:hypothetical protein